jgi:hypothetical protein
MARKRKTLTPTQQAYKKQVRRIKQFIRRAEKRGYQFDENVLPKQPKRITKQSVERLRKLTPEQLYKKAEYGGQASFGEVITGTEGRQLERKESARKAVETRKARQNLRTISAQERQFEYEPPTDYDYDYEEDYNEPDFDVEDNYNEDTSFFDRTVISMFRAKLTEYNEIASQRLLNWFDSVRASQGDSATAEMIQKAQEAGVGLERKDSYDSNKVQEYIGAMMDYLPEAGEFTKQDIMDALEYEESYEPPF